MMDESSSNVKQHVQFLTTGHLRMEKRLTNDTDGPPLQSVIVNYTYMVKEAHNMDECKYNMGVSTGVAHYCLFQIMSR